MPPTSIVINTSTATKAIAAHDTPTHALILLHGRGASTDSILTLTSELSMPRNCLVLAPEAPGNTWYPKRFTVPQTENEPHLSRALMSVRDCLQYLSDQHGITAERIIIAGFSQGACLTAEFLKRNPQRYAGAVLFSGGLVGTDAETEADIPGSLTGTPMYIGCDEEDFHIPKQRVEQTATYFKEHGADVTMRLYQGLGHTIHPEGLGCMQRLLDSCT